jgi:hypothetical protein
MKSMDDKLTLELTRSQMEEIVSLVLKDNRRMFNHADLLPGYKDGVVLVEDLRDQVLDCFPMTYNA